ncbi:ATP-grasp domain-containing protein [Halobacillus mangrovi]|uniref:Carboxylate--amine ligase n=1 Tax=Halobacillus mangrovi TaxID=402384 RepID=A0A1W5ZX65_9BACI|nr:carboxylate--amine ligase [Halobacillus mangrovi]ARI77898.1 carboxylate--amine ligase [Halobacillus mangrovi]
MPRTNTETNTFKSTNQQDRKRMNGREVGPLKITHERPEIGKKIALIGWSIPSIEAIQQMGKEYIIVSHEDFKPYADQHQVPFLSWDFGKPKHYQEVYEKSRDLFDQLRRLDVGLAIPIFEETVEWSGALNARFRNDPSVFEHSILFRDKAMMKRRAHLGGLKVGVFEEVESKEEVRRFFKRVNQSLLKNHKDHADPIHFKALNKAGAAGHRMIFSEEDIDQKLTDDNFPGLVESHLSGIEVSCEVFIHKGKVQFLNITEYVLLGYSSMVPPSAAIEQYRTIILKEVEKLIEAFDIQYGMVHPEFFITEKEEVYFGEIAYRIPGGHIFELIQKVYGFNPFGAHLLCCDPHSTAEELERHIPKDLNADGHAGSFMVYPKKKSVSRVHIPSDLEGHPNFDKHTLYKPTVSKFGDTGEGYGNHWGTVFFHGEDSNEISRLLTDYVDHDFYV